MQKHFLDRLYELIVQRKLARFFPWILAGLIIAYFLTFPFLKGPIWVTIPVVLTGWFFYRRAGFWAGLLALPINFLLIDRFMYEMNLTRLFQFSNWIAGGHILVMFVGAGAGLLREKVEQIHESNRKNSLHERQITLVNLTVKDVLEAKDIEDAYFLLLNHLCNLFVADYGYMISSSESPHDVIVVASTRISKQLPAGATIKQEDALITQAVLKSGHVLAIEDAQTSQLIAKAPLFHENYSSVRSVLAVPMIAKGYRFGAVILAFEKPQKFDHEEISYFQLIGSQITLALRSVLQEHKIQKQLREAHALASIERALSESEKIGLDAVLQRIVDSAKELIPSSTHVVLHLLDDEKRVLIPRAVSGKVELRKSNLTMHLGEGVAGQALSTGDAIAITDIWTDQRFLNRTMPNTFRSMIVAPVHLGQHRIGTISVLGAEVGRFETTDVDLLISLGTLAAIAIENAALYDSMQNEIKERIKLEDSLRKSIASERELRLSAETTTEASFALVSNLDERAVLHEVLAQVEKLLPGYAYKIELIEDDCFLSVKAHRGYEKYGHDLSEHRRFHVEYLPLKWTVIREQKVLVVPDTEQDPRWVALSSYAWVRSHMCIPLLWKDQMLGILNIDHEVPNMLSDQSAEGLKTLVNVAVAVIANAQLLDKTRQALNETSSMYVISREMVALNVNELLRNTVEMLQQNFGYYQVLFYLYDSPTGDLVLKSASGTAGQILYEKNHRLPAGMGIIGHACATSTPFLTNNVDDVIFFSRNALLPETKSELAVPLKMGNQPLGVLDVQQSPPNLLTSRDLQLVSSVADQLSVSLQNANLYESLQTALKQEQTMRFQLMQSERLAMVGRLLASISHELNNPLQAIQNVLFLLKGEKDLSEQGRQDLEVILAETDRMTSLIGRLRSTYRTPQFDEFRDIHLNSVIEDVYALTGTYMRHKKIALEFYPDMQLPVFPGVPDQIRQALLNVFMNAIDAMPTGGKIIVQTQNLAEQNQILVSVSDTGTGISPDILPHIFEPFTTDKDTGTGLGMTITHDIILQHRGEIQAGNNPAGGAVFMIWFPVQRQE